MQWQGLWFTNEFVAFELTKAFYGQKNFMLAGSGLGLVALAVVIGRVKGVFVLDPLDADLLIQEQAINLTSQHTAGSFRTLMRLDDFYQEVVEYARRKGKTPTRG